MVDCYLWIMNNIVYDIGNLTHVEFCFRKLQRSTLLCIRIKVKRENQLKSIWSVKDHVKWDCNYFEFAVRRTVNCVYEESRKRKSWNIIIIISYIIMVWYSIQYT